MSSAPDKTPAGRETPNDGPPGSAEWFAGAGGYPSDTLPSTEGSGHAEAVPVTAGREAAYTAVRSVISQLGDHLPVAPVARNAIIWLAVENALDAHDAAMVRERHRRIDALTRAAYEDGRGDGRVEGRRQATEGWERRLRYRYASGQTTDAPIEPYVTGWLAALHRGERIESSPPGRLEQRLVGPWGPVDPCPTCSGPTRETVGMVCQTCGTDYAPAEGGAR